MEISTVLVLTIAIVILLSLVVFTLEMYLPLQVKTQMLGLCRPYIFSIEAYGELSESDCNDLKIALEDIGLKDISIVISDDQKKFGDLFRLKIEGSYTRNRLVSLFSRDEEMMVMVYERKLVYRRINN